MMAATHALVGAALGGWTSGRLRAFVLGIAAHAAGDLVPHRTVRMWQDFAMTMGVLAAIALLRGPRSSSALGALGGALPDAEHLAARLGLLDVRRRLFPSHWRRLHGKEGNGWLAQLLLLTGSAAAILCSARGQRLTLASGKGNRRGMER